jgi:hypothetical protein
MVFKPHTYKHSAGIPLRAALYERLTNGMTLEVFNANAPPNQTYPYVILAEDTTGPEFSTKTTEGEELRLTVNIYAEDNQYGNAYDQLDEFKEQLLVALSMTPLYLGSHWEVILQGIDSGTRKWRYAIDKAQQIVYLRFKMDYIE